MLEFPDTEQHQSLDSDPICTRRRMLALCTSSRHSPPLTVAGRSPAALSSVVRTFSPWWKIPLKCKPKLTCFSFVSSVYVFLSQQQSNKDACHTHTLVYIHLYTINKYRYEKGLEHIIANDNILLYIILEYIVIWNILVAWSCFISVYVYSISMTIHGVNP